MKCINPAVLERLEQVAQDTKKVFAYDKHAGTWSWADKEDADEREAHHGGFTTRHEALSDAVEPHMVEAA